MRSLIFLFFVKFLMLSLNGQEIHKNEAPLISIPLITTYTPSDYYAGIQNWSIDQDTSGYMYFANNYGLLEFDGATWNNYPIAGNTKTRSLLIDDHTNRIYIGGQKQLGYFAHSEQGLDYQSLVHLMPETIAFDEVWDLVSLDNRIYANINGTIIQIENDSIQRIPLVSNVDFITKIEDELIAGSTNGIYLKKGKGDFDLLPGIKGDEYRGAIKKDQGDYLIFTYDGHIVKYNNEEVIKLKTSIDQFLSESKINRVLQLSNGKIVIATQNNGLVILDKNLEPEIHLTKNKGLNHRTVISLYEDDFNNLWVGLNNGICIIELGSPFSMINENVGLEGTGYAAVMHENDIYLGTSSGLFKPLTKKNFETNHGYDLVEGSEGLVNNVSIIDNQIILSHHEGAYSLNREGISQFYDETGAWEFKQLPSEKLIGGTYEGFVLFNNKGSITSPKKLEGLPESSRVFEFINDSSLWMTHGYKGAYKVTLKNDSIHRVEHYGFEDGFPSDILISVYRIEDDLIFTAESGIYQYNDSSDRFEPHPFLYERFTGRHVSKIKEAGDHNIYYIAGGNVGVLKKKAIGIYQAEEKQFRKINSFISDDLENINIINDDNILIGAKEGFILYKPSLDGPIRERFSTYLKNVSITTYDDQTFNISGQFFNNNAVERTKKIRLSYSSPFYDGLKDIQYSYRLKPYEDKWSNWSPTNWKEYTNLPPRKYEFEIKSMNVYGNESSIASYTFTIKPRWYESNIAYGVYIVTVLLIFSTVIVIRERKHKEEKLFINQSKEEVIRSKEREISEFSEKTSQEIAALRNENLKKEIDHKNSQLASVTMHLLSKNEFVMSIRKKLDALHVKDNQDSLQKIVKSIDKNIDEDDAWDTFVYHFDQVHGDFLKKIRKQINLTPQETKLCAYLKMNMSTKDIANLMNITVRGVELARYRLRKKLGINREVNLTNYLDNFN